VKAESMTAGRRTVSRRVALFGRKDKGKETNGRSETSKKR